MSEQAECIKRCAQNPGNSKFFLKSRHKMISNDLEMTFDDLEMTLSPLNTGPLAKTCQMLQKLSNIQVSKSDGSHFNE